MNYGIPYKGSKNRIAEKVVDLFPAATNFYDLFCGGCAITHRALIVNKWTNYYINDLEEQLPQLFFDAIHGKFKKETRWISREDFKKLKDKEPYIKYCWSFGNKGKNYLYGKDKEPYKKAFHYAVFYKDLSYFKALNIDVPECEETDIKKRRLFYQQYLKKITKEKAELERLQSLESLERLQRLQSLERLQRLQSLERLEATGLSYDEVEIKPDSIVYCDIPYKNTDEYEFKFDYEKFYDWCSKQKELTFISSYELPADRFTCIASFNHRSILSANKNNPVVEKVFIPNHQLELYKKLKENEA